MTLENSDLA